MLNWSQKVWIRFFALERETSCTYQKEKRLEQKKFEEFKVHNLATLFQLLLITLSLCVVANEEEIEVEHKIIIYIPTLKGKPWTHSYY